MCILILACPLNIPLGWGEEVLEPELESFLRQDELMDDNFLEAKKASTKSCSDSKASSFPPICSKPIHEPGLGHYNIQIRANFT